MKKLGFLIVFIWATTIAFSQTINPELVSSSGDSFSNATYQLDWSIGECATATHIAGDFVLTQGFHQNTYVITATEDLRADINMSVYPNPATDLVSLQVESSKERNMQYTLTDISGKVLQNEKILSSLQTLNFTNYTSNVYFLTVKQENQVIKIFKIIKN